MKSLAAPVILNEVSRDAPVVLHYERTARSGERDRQELSCHRSVRSETPRANHSCAAGEVYPKGVEYRLPHDGLLLALAILAVVALLVLILALHAMFTGVVPGDLLAAASSGDAGAE